MNGKKLVSVLSLIWFILWAVGTLALTGLLIYVVPLDAVSEFPIVMDNFTLAFLFLFAHPMLFYSALYRIIAAENRITRIFSALILVCVIVGNYFSAWAMQWDGSGQWGTAFLLLSIIFLRFLLTAFHLLLREHLYIISCPGLQYPILGGLIYMIVLPPIRIFLTGYFSDYKVDFLVKTAFIFYILILWMFTCLLSLIPTGIVRFYGITGILFGITGIFRMYCYADPEGWIKACTALILLLIFSLVPAVIWKKAGLTAARGENPQGRLCRLYIGWEKYVRSLPGKRYRTAVLPENSCGLYAEEKDGRCIMIFYSDYKSRQEHEQICREILENLPNLPDMHMEQENYTNTLILDFPSCKENQNTLSQLIRDICRQHRKYLDTETTGSYREKISGI